jgi:hypothetical protein
MAILTSETLLCTTKSRGVRSVIRELTQDYSILAIGNKISPSADGILLIIVYATLQRH